MCWPCSGMSRRDIAGPFLALLLLSALPGSACAQVFIASHPQPEFSIGPLFVSASVGKPNVVGNPGALTVSVSWSLTLAPHRRAADIAQDLCLLLIRPIRSRRPAQILMMEPT